MSSNGNNEKKRTITFLGAAFVEVNSAFVTTGPRAGSAGRAAWVLPTLRARPRKEVESVAAIVEVWKVFLERGRRDGNRICEWNWPKKWSFLKPEVALSLDSPRGYRGLLSFFLFSLIFFPPLELSLVSFQSLCL